MNRWRSVKSELGLMLNSANFELITEGDFCVQFYFIILTGRCNVLHSCCSYEIELHKRYSFHSMIHRISGL